MNRPFQLLVYIIFSLNSFAQHLQFLNSGTNVSLRGLSVVSDQVVWVSGSEGTVGLSTNGGTTWKWMQVPHYEKSDFRDIEAFNDREAIIMGVTEPAVMLLTSDGGVSWQKVFGDTSKTAFWDAMVFSGDRAVVVGDPLGNQIFLAESSDRGKTWEKISSTFLKRAVEGESFFAASGSNIKLLADGTPVFVSGGKQSCIYYSGIRMPLWIIQGGESTGANSIAINPVNKNNAIVVGGDFKNDTIQSANSVLIHLHPFSQVFPAVPPHGYRSCVEYVSDLLLICCGTSGVDISNDGGNKWQLISDKSFHVCQKSKSGNFVFLAGAHGNMAKWQPGT
jgi:hypothetical protein